PSLSQPEPAGRTPDNLYRRGMASVALAITAGHRRPIMSAPVRLHRPTPRPFIAAHADFTTGADTPRAFLERCLDALAVWEPEIGASVTLSVESARTAADRSTERWRAGAPLSPIDGMPVGIKDIIETIDMPTENGSPLFEDYRTLRDAASV